MKVFGAFPIKIKLTILLLLVSFATLIISSTFFIYNDLNIFKKNLLKNLTTLAGAVGANSRAAVYFGDKATATEILSSLEETPQIQYAAIYDSKGEIFVTYQGKGLGKQTFQVKENTTHIFKEGKIELKQPIILKDKKIGEIYLSADLGEYNSVLKNYLFIVGIILFSTLGIALILSIILQKILSKPILTLAKATKKISENNDYSIRVSHQSQDEIGDLYLGFNQMISQIEKREKELNIYLLSIRRAENKLAKSEAELAHAQKIAHLGNWVFEIHSNELRWSDEVYRIFGLKPLEFAATSEAFLDRVHPDDREFIERSVRQSLESKKPYNIEHRVIRPDGEERFVHEQSEIVYDEEGKPLRMIGTVLDITGRKRVEDELREKKDSLAKTEEISLVMPTHVGLDGMWLKVPNRLCELLGYTREELLGNKFESVTHPDDFMADWSQCQRLIRGEIKSFDLEKRYIRKDGEIVWVYLNCSIVEDREGKPLHFVTYIRDITERKQAENQVQIRAQQQAVVAQFGLLALEGKEVEGLMKEAVEMIASNLQVEFAKILELLPGDKEFLLRAGVGWKEGLVGTAIVDTGLNSQAGFTLLTEGPVIVEDLNTETRFNPAVFLVDHGVISGLSVVIQERGKLIGILGAHSSKRRQFSADDVNFLQAMANVLAEAITRKRAEEEKQKLDAHYRQQQKLESIGLLAGGVAHEINNPINGIMNYAQLIEDRLESSHPLREFSSEIIHETERVAHIIKNLLSFARQENEAHSPANVSDIVEGTLSLIRTIVRGDQISLEINVPDDLPPVKCHSQQIQQVLMNLLTNARDALNERYPEYNPDKIISVTARLFREGKWIRITIEDHGMGIPDEKKERLFDPFFTTKDRTKGTGLGLSISYGIIREHHGELSVETKAGKYTKFHVDLKINKRIRTKIGIQQPVRLNGLKADRKSQKGITRLE